MSTVSLSAILQLSVNERLCLATAIWDSIAEHPETLPLTEEQKQEIERRSESYRRNPQDTIPLEEAVERIRRSL